MVEGNLERVLSSVLILDITLPGEISRFLVGKLVSIFIFCKKHLNL